MCKGHEGTATFIKDMQGWRGDARLYQVEPPVTYRNWPINEDKLETNYVIVSGIDNEWGCETYIFPSDSTGDCPNMLELDGSFSGDVDHQRALYDAGYEIQE